MLTVSPKNPNILLGVSGAKRIVKAYLSKDGGVSWEDRNFPEMMEFEGGDPQAAFSKNGTAYISIYSGTNNRDGEEIPSIYFYRSFDKGKTWDKSLSENLFGKLTTYDHDQLVVDQTDSKFAGRIYLSVLGGVETEEKFKNQHLLTLLSSDDSGKSFAAPQTVVRADKGKGVNVTQLLVSSKGTLFFTYIEWFNDTSLPNYFNGRNIYLVSSNDGGSSFSLPEKIGSQNTMVDVFPQYAIDNKSLRYRDRLYCVFKDVQNGKSKLMFTYSKDEGKTWSTLKLVDPNSPDEAKQFQPAIVVNSKGVIGIRWQDTRGTEEGKGFNEYFTASLDGGETFLSPVRVSSETSYYKSEIAAPVWNRSADKDSLVIYFRRGDGIGGGGDYQQFDVDANGVFHDFWSDSREFRTYQIFTSAIKVIESGDKEIKKKSISKKKIKKETISTVSQKKSLSQIARYIYLKMDLASYDTATNLLSIPVRIKNISNKPIYGPINLEISKIDTTNSKSVIPIILNSTNGQSGAGAKFNYVLPPKKGLLPGEETETVTWKFNVKIPKEIWTKVNMIYWYCDKISALHLSVTGYMRQ